MAKKVCSLRQIHGGFVWWRSRCGRSFSQIRHHNEPSYLLLQIWGEMFGLEDRDIVHNADCIQIERPGVGKAYMRRPPWLFPETKATYELYSGVCKQERRSGSC